MAKSPANILRVGICNPNSSIRFGKSMLINSQQDMQVVFEASSSDEVLAAIENLTLDVLIIDHRLSGNDGTWLVRTINKEFFDREEWPPTMIVTAPFFAVDLDIAVMRAGAADFVVEESGAEQLLAAIRNSSLVDQSLDISALNQLFEGVALAKSNDAQFNLAIETLEPNALAVLEAFASGLDDKQIAESLSFSVIRVRQLFRRILIHFAFATRAQLALALYDSQRLNL